MSYAQYCECPPEWADEDGLCINCSKLNGTETAKDRLKEEMDEFIHYVDCELIFERL